MFVKFLIYLSEIYSKRSSLLIFVFYDNDCRLILLEPSLLLDSSKTTGFKSNFFGFFNFFEVLIVMQNIRNHSDALYISIKYKLSWIWSSLKANLSSSYISLNTTVGKQIKLNVDDKPIRL